MSVMEVKICTNQWNETQPVCGLPMMRWGKSEEAWAWVCAVCDGDHPVENSLDGTK